MDSTAAILFAISDAVWLAIIPVAVLAINEYFNRLRTRAAAVEAAAKEKRMEDARIAAEERAEKARIAAEERAEKARAEADKKLTTVMGNVQKIETATNSMKDALVLATAKEGYGRGKSEERERADAVVAGTTTVLQKVAQDIKADITDAAMAALASAGEVKEKVEEVPDKVVEKLQDRTKP